MVLQSLSDQEVLSRIHELAARERSLTRLVLLHLNEIERRRLHLKQGYASMFDYCTTGLGYSASAAARRIRTARCIARFPEVWALLEKNEVNLSTMSQVSRILTPFNKDDLLTRIAGKSQRDVDAIVAEYEPRALPRERVKPVVVRVPVAETPCSRGAVAPALGDGVAQAVDAGGEQPFAPVPDRTPSGADGNHCRSGSEIAPNLVTERRMLLSFSASEPFMAKLDKVKSLAWHRLPANPSLEQVFELVMDCYIVKKDPTARRERRQVREAVPGEKLTTSHHAAPSRHGGSRDRYVAAAVKDEVFTRDQRRCTYVGVSGKRCTSTRALQIDHIHPVARGGGSNAGNLRLLCAYHNRLEAERVLGAVGGTRPRGLRP